MNDTATNENGTDKTENAKSKFYWDMPLQEWWDALPPIGKQAMCGIAIDLKEHNTDPKLVFDQSVSLDDLMHEAKIDYTRSDEVEAILEEANCAHHFSYHELDGLGLAWLQTGSYPFVLERVDEVMEAAKSLGNIMKPPPIRQFPAPGLER